MLFTANLFDYLLAKQKVPCFLNSFVEIFPLAGRNTTNEFEKGNIKKKIFL